jgi:hypothetical protein
MEDLPRDVWTHLLQTDSLSLRDVLALSSTCRFCRQLVFGNSNNGSDSIQTGAGNAGILWRQRVLGVPGVALAIQGCLGGTPERAGGNNEERQGKDDAPEEEGDAAAGPNVGTKAWAFFQCLSAARRAREIESLARTGTKTGATRYAADPLLFAACEALGDAVARCVALDEARRMGWVADARRFNGGATTSEKTTGASLQSDVRSAEARWGGYRAAFKRFAGAIAGSGSPNEPSGGDDADQEAQKREEGEKGGETMTNVGGTLQTATEDVMQDVARTLSCVRKMRKLRTGSACPAARSDTAAAQSPGATAAKSPRVDALLLQLQELLPDTDSEKLARALKRARTRSPAGGSDELVGAAANLLFDGELDSDSDSGDGGDADSNNAVFGGGDATMPQLEGPSDADSLKAQDDLELLLIRASACFSNMFEASASASAASASGDLPSLEEVSAFWRVLYFAFARSGFAFENTLPKRMFRAHSTRADVSQAARLVSSGGLGTCDLAQECISVNRSDCQAQAAAAERPECLSRFPPRGTLLQRTGLGRNVSSDADVCVSVVSKSDSSGYCTAAAGLFSSIGGGLPASSRGSFWFEFSPICAGNYSGRPCGDNGDAMGVGAVFSSLPVLNARKGDPCGASEKLHGAWATVAVA